MVTPLLVGPAIKGLAIFGGPIIMVPIDIGSAYSWLPIISGPTILAPEIAPNTLLLIFRLMSGRFSTLHQILQHSIKFNF